MARIEFKNIRHSYPAPAGSEPVYALKDVNQVWKDGGAYALLGPSGCGKTTLLNIISGLLIPTEGQVLFDDQDITSLPTSDRHIAQVFQFPVVYDTMTVYDNLAFPLRNRGVAEAEVKQRVEMIADMLEMTPRLKKRASGLTADDKQKISLGRGLVRPDVNVIMFDEPLTVIDPHLKWLLRSKLKELHQQTGITMIYVTHDQTEALTFADRVALMHDGQMVQVGTPVDLFNRPEHTFVGHFIGSPGMNLLHASIDSHQLHYQGHSVDTYQPLESVNDQGLEIGIRPEFVRFNDNGIPVNIEKVDDLGRIKIVTVSHEQDSIKMIVEEGEDIPSESPRIGFDAQQTHVYQNSWILGGQA